MPAPQPLGFSPPRPLAIQACNQGPQGPQRASTEAPARSRSPFDPPPPMGLNQPENSPANPAGAPSQNPNGAPGEENSPVQILMNIIEHLLELLMNRAQNGQNAPQGADGANQCDGSTSCNHCGNDSTSPVSAGRPTAAGASPRQAPAGGNAPGVGPLPPEPTSGPVAPSSDLTRFPGVNDPQLQEHINRLGTDPEGRNLLQEAQRRGVRIEVGDVGRGTLAHFDPNENKIVVGRETMRNGTGLASLAHELVHATTPHDGDSQHEEGMANVIANRISNRINGRRPDNAAAIYNNTTRLYPELAGNNPGFDANINRVLGGNRNHAQRPRFQPPPLTITA